MAGPAALAGLRYFLAPSIVESVGNGYGIAIKLILKVVLSINGNRVPCRRECICCTLDYVTERIIRRN